MSNITAITEAYFENDEFKSTGVTVVRFSTWCERRFRIKPIYPAVGARLGIVPRSQLLNLDRQQV